MFATWSAAHIDLIQQGGMMMVMAQMILLSSCMPLKQMNSIHVLLKGTDAFQQDTSQDRVRVEACIVVCGKVTNGV